MTFDDLVKAATGFAPYPYQRRLAEDGPADVIDVPTGSGKTIAAVLPWLYRRKFHPESEVREATPRWLVVVLPMRVLVNQTHDAVGAWLARLGLDSEVDLHLLLGGQGKSEIDWRMRPDRDAVFVATLDMALSRALNRGYGQSRWSWPIDFGLFNSGTHWVFDEVQLMGVALATSRQLQGFRNQMGTAAPSSSTWMSATVDRRLLDTIDAPAVDRVVDLGADDLASGLAARTDAPKVVRRLVLADEAPKTLAAEVLAQHQTDTRTIVIRNTVDGAVKTYSALKKQYAGSGRVVLLHSRFRPADRADHVHDAIEDAGETIVVSTQVIEAGVDTSSRLLVTEAAPWVSIVQRAGRCNRSGDELDAEVRWFTTKKSAPYDQAEVDLSVEALESLESQVVSPRSLADANVEGPTPILPVLRRRDLLELFDTTPDLVGGDIDVSQFIRVTDDLDLDVAWWDVRGQEEVDRRRALPAREERCPVPVQQLREALKGGRLAWRTDPVAGSGWTRCRPADVRPGMVVVLRAQDGGYDPEVGWDPTSTAAVPVIEAASETDAFVDEDLAVGDDPATAMGEWIGLSRHLADVEAEVKAIRAALPGVSLDQRHWVAAELAGRYHDIGKAHHVFVDSLRSFEPPEEPAPPWAKSGGKGRLRHGRRTFRHELASALALSDAGAPLLDECGEANLVRYLVAAHHGRVRLGVRAMPDGEVVINGRSTVLGVDDGETMPEVVVPGGVVPESTMRLYRLGLGSASGEPSWTDRALHLRDRTDLGVFRLAFLEAIVRSADWRASAAYDQGAST